MEREVALRKLNAEPVICAHCHQQFPNYRMFIDIKKLTLCFACSTNSEENIASISQSYRSYFLSLIERLPLPEYSVARQCLYAVKELKGKTDTLLSEVKKKIEHFQKQLNEFVQLTKYICQSYIEKVKTIEESSVQNWIKTPPKFIQQQKFIFNMKQKLAMASKIEESLKELTINIPNLQNLKKSTPQSQQKVVCYQNCITAATKVKASLYLGTSDGRIIFQNNCKQEEIRAHQSLIRVLQYDQQSSLFSGSDDQTIKLWHIIDQVPKLFKVFGSLPGIKSFHRQLVVSDGGRCLASTRGQFDQYKIRLWDLQSFENMRTLSGHSGYIKGMVGTVDNRLVTVSEDRYLKIWRVKQGICQNEHFHSCKINYVFVNDHYSAVCMVDQANKVSLLDLDSLQTFNAVTVAKKIQLAQASSAHIYVMADRYIFIYSWNLALLERIEIHLTYAATNFVELVNKLIVTDANGTLHQLLPNTLKTASL